MWKSVFLVMVFGVELEWRFTHGERNGGGVVEFSVEKLWVKNGAEEFLG